MIKMNSKTKEKIMKEIEKKDINKNSIGKVINKYILELVKGVREEAIDLTLAEVNRKIDERIKFCRDEITRMKKKYYNRPSTTRKRTYLQYRKTIAQLEKLKKKVGS